MKKENRSNLGRVLAYLRFAIAGAIGGVAVVNTFSLTIASNPHPSAETVAMAVGAAALAGLAKALHAV